MLQRHTGKAVNDRVSCTTLALAIAIAVSLPTYAVAQTQNRAHQTVITFDIPAGDLSLALERFSTQSGIQVMYRQELLVGKKVSALRGSLAPAAALDRLLVGTGIASERANDKTYVLKMAAVRAQQKSEGSGGGGPKASDPGGDEVDDLEQVIVVGSRLGTSPVESAMPIRVITREDIDRSGAGNIAQALSYLSEVSVNNSGDTNIGGTAVFGDGGNVNATTVQMRGLPRGTTLVLINGRRAGESSSFTSSGQFDLSSVPLALVERIEVLPAGSSAIYGGDALAGVVNVVLREGASGTELRVRRTQAEGYRSEDASFLFGKTWSRGDVTFAASWKRNDALFSTERSLTADQDYRRFGGLDRRATGGYPATVYSLAGCPTLPCTIPIGSRENLPGLTSQIAVVPLDQNGEDLQPEDFIGMQGVVLRQNSRRHLFSADKSIGASLRGTFHLNESLDVFTEWNYTKRDVPAYQIPLVFDSGVNGAPRATLPGDHPFNPFGVPVAIAVRINETGIYTDYGQSYLRGLLGFRGRFGRFDWEVSAWKSEDESRSIGGTVFDSNAVIRALASKDPTATVNPFVSDGSAPASREFLLSMIAATQQISTSETRAATGFIKGPVFSLPAGDLIVLAGAERLEQELSIQSNASGVLVPSIQGGTSSDATFAEFRAPILSSSEGASRERLALTGAIRSESSDRFEGDARTSAVGLEFRPWSPLMLRATHSTAFKPILSYSAVQNPLERTASIADPRMGGVRYVVDAITTGGVPPELAPERSWTTTVGATYRPSSNMNVTVTLWDTKFRDRISFLALQSIVDNEALYPGRVVRDAASGLIESVDGRQVNISLIRTSGVDLGVDWSWYFGAGSLHPSIAATYVHKYEEQLTQESALQDWRAIYNRAGGWAPKWKVVPRLTWEHQNWLRLMVAGRYVSSYQDTVAYSSGPMAGRYGTLGNFWLMDTNVDLSLNKIFARSPFTDVRLALGATNLLNKLPDYCVACGVSGYDSSQYDIMGRTIYAELRVGL